METKSKNKNIKLILLMFIFVLMCSSVNATIDWNTDVEAFIPLFDTTNSSTHDVSYVNGVKGGYNLTNNYSYVEFDGTNDYIQSTSQTIGTGAYTISFWYPYGLCDE